MQALSIKVARHIAEQAVETARQLDDDRLVIESLSMLSDICHFASDPERGFPHGQEAVERPRLLGDDVLLADSLASFLLCSELIDPASRGGLFAEAIACTERSGDRYLTATLQNNPGVFTRWRPGTSPPLGCTSKKPFKPGWRSDR